MKRKEIEFTIGATGEITFTVKGAKGSGCMKIVDQLRGMGRILEEARTREFYEEAHQVSSIYAEMKER